MSFSAYTQLPELRAIVFVGLSTTMTLILSALGHLTLLRTALALPVLYILTRWIAQGSRFNWRSYSLQGRTVILTGCASGIGLPTARALSHLRPKCLILAVRGQQRAQELAAEVARQTKTDPSSIVGLDLDVSSLASVKRFVDNVKQRCSSLDLLINNAGIVANQDYKAYRLNEDGFEPTWATHCIGPSALVDGLMPLLQVASQPRIVNVSSMGLVFFAQDGIDYSLCQRERVTAQNYNHMKLYGQSKLGQLYHARELTRRFSDHGLSAYSVHPGTMATPLNKVALPSMQLAAYNAFIQLVGKTEEAGSETTLYCALSDKAVPGGFHQNCQLAIASQIAEDGEKTKEFWDRTHSMIKEHAKAQS